MDIKDLRLRANLSQTKFANIERRGVIFAESFLFFVKTHIASRSFFNT